ncbi:MULTISPECIES: hypothetical protein [Pseudonocardiaceae]|uniref:Uncharacterized protein n=1 Tax=Amycolatopsis roodepoortensis TaxID=700274 RepID=A0ABR9LFP4_9PSEU|nr:MULTISPECIES: hypothetical protein [Pseudonocardiaceae]MBE1579515.1 hypothetical protein [Amycolatopsis roodepoortensis]
MRSNRCSEPEQISGDDFVKVVAGAGDEGPTLDVGPFDDRACQHPDPQAGEHTPTKV